MAIASVLPVKYFGLAAYKGLLKNLLPPGPLWRNLNSTFELLMEASAVELDRIDTRFVDLQREATPANATAAELLGDWETELLLPDEMPAAGASEVVRQNAVHTKANLVYGTPTAAFWVSLAAGFGMTVMVTDLVGGGDVARIDEAVVEDDFISEETDNAIFNIQVTADPNSQLTRFQALVDRIKHAHTQVTYS